MDMLYEFIASRRGGISLRVVICLLVVLIIVGLLVWVFWPRVEFTQRHLHETSLTDSENFVYLKGDSLLFFNGAGFFETDIENSGTIRSLSKGKKLPVPENMYWLDSQGVVVNFQSSFFFTEVRDIAKNHDSEIHDEFRDYTWYFDFEDSSLSIVDELPIRNNGLLFSSERQGFYYIPDYSQFRGVDYAESYLPFDGGEMPFYFYDISTQDRQEVSQDLGVVDINSLTACSVSEINVCLLARDVDDISRITLFSLDSEGNKNPVIESSGGILATNNPDIYIEINDENQNELSSEERIEHPDTERHSARIHNLEEETRTDMGIDLSQSNVILYFDDSNNEFYLFDDFFNVDDDRYYQAGVFTDRGSVHTSLMPIAYKDGSLLERIILYRSGYNKSGDSLLTTSASSQDVFLFSSRDIGDFSYTDEGGAERIVEECQTQTGVETFQYFHELSRFRVFFEEGNNLEEDIEAFVRCITEEDSTISLGYMFSFEVLDSNGRIISD